MTARKPSLESLAEVIHEHTMMEGPELQAMTYHIAAAYADMVGRRDIGDYYMKRSHEVYPPEQQGGR